MSTLSKPLAVLAALRAGTGNDARAADRPNIVVILADDIGYGELGCHEEARARIVATHETLESTLDLREADIPEVGRAIARPERVEAELTRIAGGIMARGGLA